MGFAIPIDSAKPIIEQLIQYNKVKRPYMGISGRDLDETTAKRNNLVVGVYVASVDEYSAKRKSWNKGWRRNSKGRRTRNKNYDRIKQY